MDSEHDEEMLKAAMEVAREGAINYRMRMHVFHAGRVRLFKHTTLLFLNNATVKWFRQRSKFYETEHHLPVCSGNVLSLRSSSITVYFKQSLPITWPSIITGVTLNTLLPSIEIKWCCDLAYGDG